MSVPSLCAHAPEEHSTPSNRGFASWGSPGSRFPRASWSVLLSGPHSSAQTCQANPFAFSCWVGWMKTKDHPVPDELFSPKTCCAWSLPTLQCQIP